MGNETGSFSLEFILSFLKFFVVFLFAKGLIYVELYMQINVGTIKKEVFCRHILSI